MNKTLVFTNCEVIPFDNGDEKIWFTSASLALLLEYVDDKSVNKIYSRNKDEFTIAETKMNLLMKYLGWSK